MSTTRSDYLRNLQKKPRAKRTPQEQAELNAWDREKRRQELDARGKEKEQEEEEEEQELDMADEEMQKYQQEFAEPRLPSLFPDLQPPASQQQRGKDVIVFDDDASGPDVYDQEFEEWYLKSTPDGTFVQRKGDPRLLEFAETPRLTAIRLMRENEKLTNAILSSFQRNHPKEYDQIVETNKKRIAEGRSVIVDLVPSAGGRKRDANDDDVPPQEGRRTPQRQAPVMTPPSAGQDEERRNRRRLTPPSEDELIDRACLYMIGKLINDVSKSEEYPETLAKHIGELAKSEEGRWLVDHGARRAVEDLVTVVGPVFAAPIGAQCLMCGKDGGGGEGEGELLRCSACKQAHYCGAECQKSDWNAAHKYECASIAIAGRNDGLSTTTAKEDDIVQKKNVTTLLRRPFGTTSRGSHAAQIVIDKERAARARAVMRASDEAKKKQQQSASSSATSAGGAKEEAKARERAYQEATISMTFTDQAVVIIDGRRYGSSQETTTGERPVTQLTSLVTYAGQYVFRDGRYRFLESKDRDAYRRKYPTERGKTSSAPWEHYDPTTQSWIKIVGHPESASGWSVYIK